MIQGYFDNNASTPIDPRIADRIEPWLRENWANPSSVQYRLGLEARTAVEEARDQVAAMLGCWPEELVFTSGATEANNLAIIGVLLAGTCDRILVSQSAHLSGQIPLALAERLNAHLEHINLDTSGRIDLTALEKLKPGPGTLVCAEWVNNETGVIQPVAEIASLVHRLGGLVHFDGAQAPGRVPVDVRATGADLATFSAQKMYGPKGVGVLFVRDGVTLRPYAFGGKQENRLRAGTENVPAIVGFGEAARILRAEEASVLSHVHAARAGLEVGLVNSMPQVRIVSPTGALATSTVLAAWPVWTAHEVLSLLDEGGFMAGAGSACSSGSDKASSVLSAMGIPHELGRRVVRFSVGRFTSKSEIDDLTEFLALRLTQGKNVKLRN